MTTTPKPNLDIPEPDSGFFSPTSFHFDSEDMESNIACTSTPKPQTPPDSPTLPWDLNDSQVFQRRKRSFSDPVSSLRIRCRNCRSVGTQTDAPPNVARQLSQQNPLLPGAIVRPEPQVVIIRPFLRRPFRDINNNPEHTEITRAIAGTLRVLGDDFNNNHQFGGFLGIQRGNNMFGAFAAFPIPQWIQNLLAHLT